MKKILNIGFVFGLMAVFVGGADCWAAAKKQSAIQMGTKVRTRTEATGVYKQECYDAYYGCMDQFCIVDNELGGSCNCSDDITKYESALTEIKNIMSEAERINTEEVEKVKAGANADIIFAGTRNYDENGNVIATKATKNDKEKKSAMWSSFYDEDDEEEEAEDDIYGKVGAELYNAAHALCKAQMSDSCSGDMNILTQMYSRQITSDCKGLANSIEQKREEAKSLYASANAAVRAALKESLEESNKYDRGTCMVEYKKCMQSSDACGSGWENCVFTIAGENMQNNTATSVAGTKVETVNTYDITPSTMEILESKRFICEKVLDSCVAVRDYVWNDFLREAAPTIRLAEANVESQKRQSCLSDISTCIQKACKDDIAGKGVETMDACLARPDMARSFCKVQIDPCERMEPQIWDYVVSKLAAMRVDACTQEVKECFTSEDRCGKDFINCIGMDFNYIHDICPIDKLVVCKQANPNFSMSDLDEMLMGLYLNIDNSALENCQNLAEEKMTELCGSTTECNAFAADEYLGSNSLRSQKSGTTYKVTGMISFGNIKMGDMLGKVTDDGGKVELKPGQIGVKDYIAQIKKNNTKSGDAAIITSIEDELNNIAGTINRTIAMLEADQQIQYCINGRELGQINGRGSKNNKTEARFPKLLDQYKVMIGVSALKKAQDNYNKKLNEEIANATKEANADIAQYMCQMLPSGGGVGLDDTRTPLNEPYAISYDVASGLDLKSLTSGGKAQSGVGSDVHTDATRNGTIVLLTPAGQGGGGWNNTSKIDASSGRKEVTSSFNRDTRMCHVCTTITVENCGYQKIKATKIKKKDCTTQVEENCEDIPM